MPKIPKVLLIGAGKFGKNYTRILKELENEGRIELAGVCETSPERAMAITAEYGVVGYADYKLALSESKADAVFVVTPPESHVQIVKDCITEVHVFVEKPLAFTTAEVLELEALALSSQHELMTGYLFRFHAVTKLLVDILKTMKVENTDLKRIDGVFVNPSDTDVGRPVSYELIHWFDLVTFLFGATDFTSLFTHPLESDRVVRFDVRYHELVDVAFTLGWREVERSRTFTLVLKNGTKISADYLANQVTVIENGEALAHDAVPTDALRNEIEYFLNVVQGALPNPVPPQAVLPSTKLAESANAQSLNSKPMGTISKRPRVAVIGAGIFGCNTAIELSDFADVTVFEKNADIMQEASFINQFRHHLGYHYPRSSETVIDIQASAPLFEDRYNEAIVRDIPSYYAISAEGSNVDADTFLAFCDNHNLPYKIARPPVGYMNEELMQLIVDVPEPIYHYPRIKRVTEDLLRNGANAIDIKFKSLVTDCELQADGTKRVVARDDNGNEEAMVLDYVVNATYAHMNAFAEWIKMPPHPVRIDVAEVLVVTLPVPLVAVTVMDGPFGGILPSGNPQQCTIYHAKASIIDRYTPEDGMVTPVTAPKSQSHYIYQECLKLFPILSQATWIESRVAHRGVLAFHEHDDARVADLVAHGFGCWSVLSGKIQSSVKTAGRLASEIKKASGLE